MRYLIAVLILFSCSIARAECYVTYDKKSKEIIDFASDQDIVMQDGWKKVTLKGELVDYGLTYHASNYFYKNNRFVVNVKKLSDIEIAQENAKKKAERLKKIKERSDKIAEQQLIDEGILEVE